MTFRGLVGSFPPISLRAFVVLANSSVMGLYDSLNFSSTVSLGNRFQIFLGNNSRF